MFVYKRLALCLGEVLAIRRRPKQAYGLPVCHLHRVNRPDIFLEMRGIGMVGPVHQNSRRVVIDGDINRLAGGVLHAEARPASP